MQERQEPTGGSSLLRLLGLFESHEEILERRAFEREASGRCLDCSQPMDFVEGPSTICKSCGKANLRADRLAFYTRSPAWVRLERILCSLWVGTVGAVWLWFFKETWFMTYNIRVFAFGCAGLAIATWIGLQITRLVTRRRISFDPAVALPALAISISAVPVIYAVLNVRSQFLWHALVLIVVAAGPAAILRMLIVQMGMSRRRLLRDLWRAADLARE